MKKILGLDLGTNSIGWALVNLETATQRGEVIKAGSRIIPMSQDIINDFGRGNKVSKTADRTHYRSARRLFERRKLRRERLIKIFRELNWLETDFSVLNDKVAYDSNNDFLFIDSYNEMLDDFRKERGSDINVPHDWTIYYLRKKALSYKIGRRELVWIIMQFNKKRGYYELRSEEEESKGTAENKEFVSEKVVNVVDTEEKRKGNKIFEITLENGVSGQIQSKTYPDWEGSKMDFIATTRTLKDGSQTCSLSVPDPEDWTLRKKRTEKRIDHRKETVGEYIYSLLLKDPYIKIRGKEVHTIERAYYKEELKRIIEAQKAYHSELNSGEFYQACIELIYPNNEAHRRMLLKRNDFTWLFVNDVIFYQRPLKSKKSLIAGCKYETASFLREEREMTVELKCAARTNPWFQEYRLWSFIHNIRIIKREEYDDDGLLRQDVDKTNSFLDEDAKEKLFDELNNRKEVNPSTILRLLKLSPDLYRMNYSDETKIKGNETRALFISGFKKSGCLEKGMQFIQNRSNEYRLWHVIYSLDTQSELVSALGNPSFGFPVEAIETFSLLPKFKKDYGSLSEKALKKIVPLMRCGRYWRVDEIDSGTEVRINRMIDGEMDEAIPDKVRERFIEYRSIDKFRALREYESAYVVYGRHSESKERLVFEKPEDIRLLTQHSLRNPVVEQVTNETLMLVKDIWEEYGRPDAIHIEMARDLKLPAEKRKAVSRKMADNERANLRARTMLAEMKKEIPSINPFSIGQTDLFRIYEEGALNNSQDVDEEIKSILSSSSPKPSELIRYKLWLDQRYLSPYTGSPISLSDLFSTRCEIEHIIPRARYFDNSFNNKIICEAEVNREKGKMTAYEFICERGGLVVKLSDGRKVTVLEKDNYEHLMARLYRKGSPKYKNLMSYDIPESFIERQLNDTRYISKTIRTLLSPVVRKENEEADIPAGIVTMPGQVTATLKRDWGLDHVWKEIVSPRFLRLNEVTESTDYYEKTDDGRSFILKRHSGLKRIDHRHHALDALVVACTTRSHIAYLNTLSNEKANYSLRTKLLRNGKGSKFKEPWQGFVRDAAEALSVAMVTYKSTNRVLTRGNNYTWKWITENGVKRKVHVRQDNADLWAVRQPLHKETVNGRIVLRRYREQSLSNAIKNPTIIADSDTRRHIKSLYKQYNGDLKRIRKHLALNPITQQGKVVERVKVITYETFSAARKPIDKTFTTKIIEEKVADSRIRSILLNHLSKHDNNPEVAFSPEGLEAMNATLRIPVRRVRVFESMGKKFSLGSTANKASKYVEAAKGTNMLFVIYEDCEGSRIIDDNSSLPLMEVIEKKKLRLPPADHIEGYRWFTLSPGSVVYMPEPDENTENIDWSGFTSEQMSKLYRCVSFSGSICYFLPLTLADVIEMKKEYGSQNKTERDNYGQMIKRHCIKLEVTRLGDFYPAIYDSDKWAAKV